MHPSEASCRPKNPDARARGAAPAHPRPYSSLNNRTPAAPGAAFCYPICSVFMFKKLLAYRAVLCIMYCIGNAIQ